MAMGFALPRGDWLLTREHRIQQRSTRPKSAAAYVTQDFSGHHALRSSALPAKIRWAGQALSKVCRALVVASATQQQDTVIALLDTLAGIVKL